MKYGLTTAQAKEALSKYGPNLLPQKAGTSAFKIFFAQIKNPFSLVLIIAVILSFLVGDKIDGFLVGGILVLNTLLGFWQEFKASKELEALRSFEVITSRVIRGGKEVEISASEIVPGDIIILEAGDKVPADGEVFESFSLEINESILTGESLPVIKSKKDNLLYLGTTVIAGRGKFTCLQTGIKTKFGNIAQTLTEVKEEKTPLEISLSKLVKGISLVVLVVTGMVFLVRYLQGFELTEVILISISLLVAAVPEGLPAVVTIVLALGVHKMYKRKALVRKMIAVETLGAATIILSDKTGTLTKNEMRVQVVKSHLEVFDSEGLSPQAQTRRGGIGRYLENEQELLKCAVLCNSANLVLKEDGGSFDILGDTTEGALLLWAKDKGEDIETLRSEGSLLEEIPFSLQTRKMTVFWDHGGKKVSYTKGAPEVVLKEVKLSDKELETWEKEYQKMASKGLRVLAFSKDQKLLGLIGIADQIRSEAKEAIYLAKQAGIKVCMVTGDNDLTAKAVSEQLGLIVEGDEVLTGAQLNLLSDDQLKERISKISVYARIAPEDKLRLVRVYQSMGEVVAVTGDGVNDALALKQAQIGVSMGKMGSDVAKEASDIVLLDDNFVTLVAAIEQGRLIYANILKVIKFLLTSNFSEILLISVASFLALPSPLLPTQILWINFVGDGLPALSLGFDGPSANLMKNPPRRGNNILGKSMIQYVLIGGISIAVVCLLPFYYLQATFSLEFARTFTFTLMVVLQMILPFIIRRHHSITSNKRLLLSTLLVLIMQVLILTVPQLRTIFKI